MRFYFALLPLLVCACALSASTPGDRGASAAIAAAQRLPIRFEPAGAGTYEARGLEYRMAIRPSECLIDLRSGGTLRFQLQGANAEAQAIPSKPLPGVSNYMVGKQRH